MLRYEEVITQNSAELKYDISFVYALYNTVTDIIGVSHRRILCQIQSG